MSYLNDDEHPMDRLDENPRSSHLAADDQDFEYWATVAHSMGLPIHYALREATFRGVGDRMPDVVVPWALCDEAADRRPDVDKFVATGPVKTIVDCVECLALMEEKL